MESKIWEILLVESGILGFGFRNPTNYWNPVLGIWNPWYGIQNQRLSWIPLHGVCWKHSVSTNVTRVKIPEMIPCLGCLLSYPSWINGYWNFSSHHVSFFGELKMRVVTYHYHTTTVAFLLQLCCNSNISKVAQEVLWSQHNASTMPLVKKRLKHSVI